MKKELISCFVTMVLFSTALTAQASVPLKPVKTGNEWKMPSDVFKRSEAFSNGLKKQLALTDSQAKKVYDAYLANTKAVDEIPMLPVSAEEKTARMKANKAAFNGTLKTLLTPAQYDKFIRKG